MLEKILKFNLKNKIALSSAGFILIIFSLLYFIVMPTVADIKTMGEEIENQRIDLERKYVKSQSLRKLAENLKNIEPNLELLNQIFINKNRELEFITTLENEANLNQISQKINLNPPTAAENQDFQKAGLQLLTKGNFAGLFKYLADLESLNYYINVKILEMSSASEKAAGGTGQTDGSRPIGGKNINLFIDADTYWN